MSVVYENTFMRVDFTFQYRIFVERFVGFSLFSVTADNAKIQKSVQIEFFS